MSAPGRPIGATETRRRDKTILPSRYAGVDPSIPDVGDHDLHVRDVLRVRPGGFPVLYRGQS